MYYRYFEKLTATPPPRQSLSPLGPCHPPHPAVYGTAATLLTHPSTHYYLIAHLIYRRAPRSPRLAHLPLIDSSPPPSRTMLLPTTPGLSLIRVLLILSLQYSLYCLSFATFNPLLQLDIPLDLVSRHFPHTPLRHLNRLVYCITPNRTVLGHNLNLDLNHLTTLVHTPAIPFTYIVNDEHQSPSSQHSDAIFRSASGYTVAFSSDHHVLAIWGHGLHLTPLHTHNYPNLLINNNARFAKNTNHRDDIVTSLHSSSRSLTQLIPSMRQSSSCRDGNPHYFEVAIAFDNKFCALYGGSKIIALAAVQDLILTANRAYTPNTCVRLALVHVDANCNNPNDPYAGFSDFSKCGANCDKSRFILKRISNFWENNRKTIHRDAAYLLSGFEDNTAVAGIASLSSACTSRGYGWIEGPSAYTLAHELGHSLSATHSRLGLMRASSIGNEQLKFSKFSATQINNFIDSFASFQCISREKPKCSSACPAKCLGGICVLPRRPSVNQVACTPTKQIYKCVQEKMVSGKRFFGVNCANNLNFALRKYNPNDLSMFCCKKPKISKDVRVIPSNYRFFTLVTRSSVGFVRTPNYISNAKDIQTATLMNTQLVPCGASGGRDTKGPPPPSSTVPVPPKNSLPDPTVPRPDVKAPTPVNPSEPRTCGVAFKTKPTMACSSERFFGQVDVKGVGNVLLLVKQEYGRFAVRMKAVVGTKIGAVAAKMSTIGNLPITSVGAPKPVGGDGQGIVLRAFNANTLPVPAGQTTCCFKKVFLYVRVKLCRGGKCGTSGVIKSKQVLCGNPCAGKPAGTILPMIPSRKCPLCK